MHFIVDVIIIYSAGWFRWISKCTEKKFLRNNLCYSSMQITVWNKMLSSHLSYFITMAYFNKCSKIFQMFDKSFKSLPNLQFIIHVFALPCSFSLFRSTLEWFFFTETRLRLKYVNESNLFYEIALSNVPMNILKLILVLYETPTFTFSDNIGMSFWYITEK